jgi:ectoine hydroxylase-related dioxygenase (phytanoyl-CoA dioxygenase family)
MQPDPQILGKLIDDGVVIVPGVLPRDEALAMRSLLQNAIDDDLREWEGKPGYIDQWMVHNLMVRGEPFAKLLENPVLHAYLTPMLTDTCIIYAYTSSSMPPQGSNFSRRIHVDSPRLIPGYPTNVGILLALDDFNDDNGPTEFLPKSQWRSDAPSTEEFERDAIRLYPKAGDACFFNARTFHRGGVNKSGKARHALSLNVCRSYMRQRFDYPRLVPEDVVDKLGPVGRRFLGFNVRVPVSLEEYYVPPEKRLYQAGQG